MPDIFDNINKKLQDAILPRFSEAIGTAGADFYVGYPDELLPSED